MACALTSLKVMLRNINELLWIDQARYLRPDVFEPIGRLSPSCRRHTPLVPHLFPLHLLNNVLPCELMLIGDRLHQRVHEVLSGLHSQDRQDCTLCLHPERLLVRAWVYVANESDGHVQCANATYP